MPIDKKEERYWWAQVYCHSQSWSERAWANVDVDDVKSVKCNELAPLVASWYVMEHTINSPTYRSDFD